MIKKNTYVLNEYKQSCRLSPSSLRREPRKKNREKFNEISCHCQTRTAHLPAATYTDKTIQFVSIRFILFSIKFKIILSATESSFAFLFFFVLVSLAWHLILFLMPKRVYGVCLSDSGRCARHPTMFPVQNGAETERKRKNKNWKSAFRGIALYFWCWYLPKAH